MYQANLARFGMELGATGWRAPDPHLQEQLRRVYLPDIRVDRRPPRNSSSKGSPSNSRAIVPWKSTHPLRPSLPHKPGAGNALESGPRDGNWDDPLPAQSFQDQIGETSCGERWGQYL